MSYKFFSEISTPQETVEQKSFIQNLEHGVALEQHIPALSCDEFAETQECIGNPERDMEFWHLQTERNSCAIACQEFVAEQLLHQDYSEEELIQISKKQGCYHPDTGMPEGHVGDILEALGLEVSREKKQTLSDLAEDLQQGRKVICSVNNMILDNPAFAEFPGQQANHAVEVIGIDISHPNDIQIILNDSGVEDGQGRRVSSDTFMKAWNTSRNFAVTAWKEV